MLLTTCPSKVHLDLSNRWSDIDTSNKHHNALIRYRMGGLYMVIYWITLQCIQMYLKRELTKPQFWNFIFESTQSN